MKFTKDSIFNFIANLGLMSNNQGAASSYTIDYLSRNRYQLEAMYRSSWVAGIVVDCVAEDMTRAGIDLGSDLEPEYCDRMQRSMKELCIMDRYCDAEKWSRLYGGAVALHMIDGQDPSTPLNLKTVRKGQYRGLLVFDRWMVQASMNELVEELGPDFGMPKFYDVVISNPVSGSTAPGTRTGQRMHYSRVVRLDGVDLPYYQRQSENYWGMSVIERLFDRLQAFDSASQGAAQLVYKAALRTYKVKGLRSIVAAAGPQMTGLMQTIAMMRLTQTNEGITLVDGDDEFETHTYSFAGLSDMIMQFGQQLSGATQIPLVRLFGQSPAGLNATGESDLRTYYDGISNQQQRRMRRPMLTTLALVSASELGQPLPDDFNFVFTPLWQMDSAEKADLAGKIVDAVLKVREAGGLVSDQTVLKELKQQAPMTGVFSNITTEDIEKADAEVPMPPVPGIDPATGKPLPGQPGGAQPGQGGAAAGAPKLGGTKPAGESLNSDSAGVDKGEWNPGAHPRASNGEFGEGSGAKSAALRPTKTINGERVAHDNSPLPAHIAKLKLPPAWSDVRINHDPDAALLAQGKDAKGRVQSVYSDAHNQGQAAAKFGRVAALHEQLPAIEAQNAKAMASSDAKTRDAAACLHLVMKMGVRPGSEGDTGADKQAYGATTLKGSHVISDGRDVSLSFVGKKGVSIKLPVDDHGLAKDLRARALKAGPDGQLYPAVSDKSLLAHVHSLGDGSFKSKDFRTHLGTMTAAKIVDSMPVPKDDKAFKTAVMDVAKQVSAKLGNTPAIALAAYIAPEVFAKWRRG